MGDPDLWDESKWTLKPEFTEEDAKRGEALLEEVFKALVALHGDGFSRKEAKWFLQDCLKEIWG